MMFKKLACIAISFFYTLQLVAQTISGGVAGPNVDFDIHVVGKYIIGSQGDTVILRGVNYAPYNWGWNSNELRIGQIALSNANAVRFVWYVNGGGAPTYANLTALDSAISKCVQAGMIAIPELHDQTCNNDTNALIALHTWWTNPMCQQILNKYKGYVIINFANEALGSGAWSWLGGTAIQFTNTYKTIINNLRNANITQPIMIDAPDCGGNDAALLSVANTLQLHDPLHKLIFSVHAYWPTPSGTAINLNNRITALQNASTPFVLGEVANTSDCNDVILIDSLLKYATQKNIGWLAWSWDRDNCASRQLTTNGLYSSITTFGNKIINNTNYGLQSKAVKILPPIANTPLSIQSHFLATCKVEKNVALLHWPHLDNAIQYEVEESKDGINFYNELNTYTNNASVLLTIPHEKTYFKVIAKLDNQTSVASNIITASYFVDSISIWPNPCTEILHLSKCEVKSTVFNVYGQIITKVKPTQHAIATANWLPGIYYLVCNNKAYMFNKQ